MEYIAVPQSHQQGLVVRSLIGSDNPAGESGRAASRLLALVADSDLGTRLTWQISRRPRGGLDMRIQTRQVNLFGDLRWALGAVMELTRTTRPVALPSSLHVTEIEPIRPRRGVLVGFTPGEQNEPHPRSPVSAWPVALRDDGRDLLEAFCDFPGLILRVHLEPATDDDITIVNTDVRKGWTERSDCDIGAYVGRPVRVRALLASPDPSGLPPRVKAVVRGWARHLNFTPLGSTSGIARRIWEGAPNALEAHAMPAGFALAVTRIPTAGREPLKGVRISRPPARQVPLSDPLARANRPVRFGRAMQASATRGPVKLDLTDLLRHLQVVGQTGTGKSTLLAALAQEVSEQGAGLTMVDPHGTTVDRIIQETSAEVARRKVVVRLGDLLHPVPINPIAIADPVASETTVAALVDLLREVFDPHSTGVLGPRWERWFALIAEATIVLLGPRASLTAMSIIGGDQAMIRRVADAIKIADPALATRLMSEYGSLREAEAAEFTSWAMSKFQRLVGSPYLRAVLGSGADALRLDEHIDSDRVLLIDLAMPELGPPAARTLGMLILQQLWSATTSRAHRDRPHVLLLDEAHLFQHGALPSILAEGRKFGLAAVVAHQHELQLAPDLRYALQANTGGLVAFRSSVEDAIRLGVRLGGWPALDLTRLPALQAAASLVRDGVPSPPFTLEVDHNTRTERAITANGTFAEEITTRSRQLLSDPYRALGPVGLAEIDAAIRARTRPPQVVKLPASTDDASFLDEWLAEPVSGQPPSA